MKMRLRVAAITVGVVGLFGLTAGVAFAHECFNASRSAQADQMIALRSHGHFDLQTSQFYALFLGTPCDPTSGPCPQRRAPSPDTPAALWTASPGVFLWPQHRSSIAPRGCRRGSGVFSSQAVTG